MKQYKGFAALGIAIALCVTAPLHSQTITESTVQPLLGKTFTATSFSSTSTGVTQATFDALLNNTGAGKTWDASTGITYGSGVAQTIEFRASTAGAPNAAQYPTANFLTRQSQSGSGQVIWSYYNLNATTFDAIAIVTDSSGINTTFGYDPPYKFLAFPASLNSSWTSTSALTSPQIPTGFTASVQNDVTYDGTGTVITPAGSVACLRFKSVQTVTVPSLGVVSTITALAYISADANIAVPIASVVRTVNGAIAGGATTYSASYTSSVLAADKIDAPLPKTFSLAQNYPNPFNPATTINFSVQKAGLTTLKVYNMLGQEMATLVNQSLSAGTYRAQWSAGNAPSGIYFYRLSVISSGSPSSGFSETKKMQLVK